MQSSISLVTLIALASCNTIYGVKSSCKDSTISKPNKPKPEGCYEMQFGYEKPKWEPPIGYAWCPATTTFGGYSIITSEESNIGYCLCKLPEGFSSFISPETILY